MDQQQNGQRQKGPQQNGPHQSGSAKKTCFRGETGAVVLLDLVILFKVANLCI